MNWFKNDILFTHTGQFYFLGQSKGRFHFRNEKYEVVFSPKEVDDMVKCGEWRFQRSE